MKKQDFALLAAIMKAAYQRDNFMSDKESVMIWYEFLQDISYEVLSKAVENYIKNETFPPTVADLRRYASLTKGDNWSIEWNKATRGAELSEMDYPGQYALQTIGREVVENSQNISVMIEFKRLYKDFSLMDKVVKAILFKSGLMVWKDGEEEKIQQNDEERLLDCGEEK